MPGKIETICLIGFGEVGGIFAADLTARRCAVYVYDTLVHDEKSRAALIAKTAPGITLCNTPEEAVRKAELVISAVTASSATSVAIECGKLLRAGQYFLDINSISPHAKRENAAQIERAGARFIEAAVMAPVPPSRLGVPMLLGGIYAAEIDEMLRALGFNSRVASADIGVASAIKMCRSILIKGLEALTVECLFAARRYGAEEAVLGSLHASFPSLGWDSHFPDYLVSRVAEHGRRRAAEMLEVAKTLKEVGIAPLMTEATAARQDGLIDALEARSLVYDSSEFSWRKLADSLDRT